ncbi:hypothetical protein ACFL55_00460 [Candidatus Latescibacterota bacterium]
MDEPGINRLCLACANQCKQSETVRIVECPRFVKLPGEEEFRRMVGDLGTIEEEAKALQKKTRALIQDALNAGEGAQESPGNGSVEDETK